MSRKLNRRPLQCWTNSNSFLLAFRRALNIRIKTKARETTALNMEAEKASEYRFFVLRGFSFVYVVHSSSRITFLHYATTCQAFAEDNFQ